MGCVVVKKNVLLVDADSKTLRMLDIGLRQAGFAVTLANSVDEAESKAALLEPDIVITDTQLPGGRPGLELIRTLRQQPTSASVPILVISSETDRTQRARTIEAGADEFLTKPLYLREVLLRVRALLERRGNEALEKWQQAAAFRGVLGELGLFDLTQTVEIGRKTGRLTLENRDQRGEVFFRDGKVVHARQGRLFGEHAFYRLLTWKEGAFCMALGPHQQPDGIVLSTQGLLLEGMRRLDEWARLTECLPPVEHAFDLHYEHFASRLPDVPEELNPLLKLFDGSRSLLDIIDESDFGDLEALEICARLYRDDLMYDVQQRARGPNDTTYQPQAVDRRFAESRIPGDAILPNETLPPSPALTEATLAPAPRIDAPVGSPPRASAPSDDNATWIAPAPADTNDTVLGAVDGAAQGVEQTAGDQESDASPSEHDTIVQPAALATEEDDEAVAELVAKSTADTLIAHASRRDPDAMLQAVSEALSDEVAVLSNAPPSVDHDEQPPAAFAANTASTPGASDDAQHAEAPPSLDAHGVMPETRAGSNPDDPASDQGRLPAPRDPNASWVGESPAARPDDAHATGKTDDVEDSAVAASSMVSSEESTTAGAPEAFFSTPAGAHREAEAGPSWEDDDLVLPGSGTRRLGFGLLVLVGVGTLTYVVVGGGTPADGSDADDASSVSTVSAVLGATADAGLPLPAASMTSDSGPQDAGALPSSTASSGGTMARDEPPPAAAKRPLPSPATQALAPAEPKPAAPAARVAPPEKEDSTSDTAPQAEDPQQVRKRSYARYLKQGDGFTRAGQFSKAIRAYKSALAEMPDMAAAHLGLGNAYYELNTLEAAVFHLEKAKELSAADPQVFLLLGAVYQSASRPKDAAQAYERYLKLAPDGKFARDVKAILSSLRAVTPR